ncbi:MAG: VWA domain-containing protein [Verrucomicrobiota bacterium JB022]|nr:VWA domain-containing protein [Verrucomicrobiota bacterium JB022]
MYLSFAQPIFLWLLPLALLVMGLLAFSAWRRSRRRLEIFAEADHRDWLLANVSQSRRHWKTGLLCAGILLVMIALARPQFGETTVEKQGRGVELLVALDVSASMRSEDVTPNRLERARLAILDLLSQAPGSKIGLIIYTREAFLQVPLTLDHNAFLEVLNEVDTYTLPQGGTDMASALREAQLAFGQNDAHHLLFVFSDGEDLEGEAIATAREAAERLRVYTVGVGTAEGGLIPDPRSGPGNFLRDPVTNEIVRTRLDAGTLQQVAQLTGGDYAQLGTSSAGFSRLVDQAIESIPEADLGVSHQTVRIDRFQWPLLLGLALLALEFVMGTRRRRAVGRATALPFALGALFLGLAQPAPLDAANLRQEAQAAYDAGDYDAAIEAYRLALEEEPDNARLLYNLGTALYRDRQYQEAEQAFTQSLQTDEIELQSKAFYNLGNTYYEAGAQALTESAVNAVESWKKAQQNFRAAIDLKGGTYPEAEDNLTYVQERIREMMRTVTLAAKPAEGGTVTGEGEFVRDTQVEIAAQANDGWHFAFWAGEPVGGKQEPKQTFKVEKDYSITGRFIKVWDLTVQVEPAEAGTAQKSGTYDANKPVEISTEGNDYWAFKGWELDGQAEIVDAAQPKTQISLQGDVTATATYVPGWKLDVAGEPALGVNAGNPGFYEKDTDVQIQAQARPGFEWQGWTGDGVADATQPQTTVHLDRDRAVTAHVNRIWNLVVLPDSDEHGTTTGGGNYSRGEEVAIKAEAREGYTFQRWEGPGVADPEAAETTVTKEYGDQDVIAVFESDNPQDQNDQNNQDQQKNSQDNQDQNQNDQNQDQDQQNQDQQQPQDQPQQPQDGDDQQEPQDQQPPENEDQQPEQPEQSEPQSPEEQPGQEQEQPQPPPGEQPQGGEQGTEEQPATEIPAELQEMSAEEAAALLRQLEEGGRILPASRRARHEERPPSQGRNW